MSCLPRGEAIGVLVVWGGYKGDLPAPHLLSNCSPHPKPDCADSTLLSDTCEQASDELCYSICTCWSGASTRLSSSSLARADA